MTIDEGADKVKALEDTGELVTGNPIPITTGGQMTKMEDASEVRFMSYAVVMRPKMMILAMTIAEKDSEFDGEMRSFLLHSHRGAHVLAFLKINMVLVFKFMVF